MNIKEILDKLNLALGDNYDNYALIFYRDGSGALLDGDGEVLQEFESPEDLLRKISQLTFYKNSV